MALELTMELARRMMRPTNLTFRYPLHNERHGTGIGNEKGTRIGTNGTGTDDGPGNEYGDELNDELNDNKGRI